MVRGDVRWYEIDMPAPGLLSFNVKSDHSNSILISLYSPSGEYIDNSSCLYGGHLSLDKAIATAGTYKIMVLLGNIPYGMTTSQVNMTSNVDMKRLPLIQNPIVLMEQGDAGWYSLTVSEPSLICINVVSDYSHTISIALYDNYGNQIDEKSQTYAGAFNLITTLATPGLYRYKVTLGGLPMGSAGSNISCYHFVMPLAGTPVVAAPTSTDQLSGTPSALASPTKAANTTPGFAQDPPQGSNITVIAGGLIGIIIIAIVAIAGLRVMRRGGRQKAVMVSTTPVSQMPGQSLSPKGDFDVFISYSSKDKNVGDAVCHGLENQKIRCWIAPRDVTVGKDFEQSIIGAIERSRILVLIFSSNANNSHHIENEVRSAWKRGIPIIPFRIEDVPFNNVIDYYIGSKHWLDSMTPPLEKHIDELADKIKGLLDYKPESK